MTNSWKDLGLIYNKPQSKLWDAIIAHGKDITEDDIRKEYNKVASEYTASTMGLLSVLRDLANYYKQDESQADSQTHTQEV
jgi:hypothetical protein